MSPLFLFPRWPGPGCHVLTINAGRPPRHQGPAGPPGLVLGLAIIRENWNSAEFLTKFTPGRLTWLWTNNARNDNNIIINLKLSLN